MKVFIEVQFGYSPLMFYIGIFNIKIYAKSRIPKFVLIFQI